MYVNWYICMTNLFAPSLTSPMFNNVSKMNSLANVCVSNASMHISSVYIAGKINITDKVMQ